MYTISLIAMDTCAEDQDVEMSTYILKVDKEPIEEACTSAMIYAYREAVEDLEGKPSIVRIVSVIRGSQESANEGLSTKYLDLGKLMSDDFDPS